MAKVQIWGFKCERCGHEWAPREPGQAPTVCPKCKSPYWNRPRKDAVSPEHRVTCRWQAHELDGKTVEYALVSKGKLKEGFGRFSASDLGDGTLQIMICNAFDPAKKTKLTQPEADSIVTHSGTFRFKCSVPQ